jgi:hypothetical protein
VRPSATGAGELPLVASFLVPMAPARTPDTE